MKDILLILVLVVILIGAILVNFSVTNGKTNFGSLAVARNSEFTMSTEQEDLSLLPFGIKWSPDSHISYITLPNGVKRFFISGNQKTFYFDTQKGKTLSDALKDKPVFKESFGADLKVSYRNGYSTIGSVLQIDSSNLNHVIGFTQNEQQRVNPDGSLDHATFTTSIGLLESFDGGASWTDYGPVIRGDDFTEPGTKISGAGHPNAIIKDNYVYVYYADWASQTNVFHADQIYLARIKILDGGKKLETFQFYKEEGFSEGEYNLKPIFPVSVLENTKYTALPSVSFNKSLRKYIAVFETNNGFVMADSQDAVSWNNFKLIFEFPKDQTERNTGDTWYSYPSLLSDKTEASDQTTSRNGNLYYSTGVWPNTAHQLTKKSFSF